MKELVVISGKGGTGKTSLVGAFASLANGTVLADCDVDAPDLAIILEPFTLHRENFLSGVSVSVDPVICNGCGQCKNLCRFDAVLVTEGEKHGTAPTFRVDPIACEGCGVCAYFCPTGAISIRKDGQTGEWFRSNTRYGPMIHAKLGIGRENSGKLVTLVRAQARKTAFEEGYDLVLVDGPPGIGCPVIASITGSDLVLVIAEPTLSALHDLSRVVALARHFSIKTLVLINKWDLNPELTSILEIFAQENNISIVGRIPYDRRFTEAQIAKKTIVEYQNNGTVNAIKNAWHEMSKVIS
jgi:MinD superfamily P-loop ATPase